MRSGVRVPSTSGAIRILFNFGAGLTFILLSDRSLLTGKDPLAPFARDAGSRLASVRVGLAAFGTLPGSGATWFPLMPGCDELFLPSSPAELSAFRGGVAKADELPPLFVVRLRICDWSRSLGPCTEARLPKSCVCEVSAKDLRAAECLRSAFAAANKRHRRSVQRTLLRIRSLQGSRKGVLRSAVRAWRSGIPCTIERLVVE